MQCTLQKDQTHYTVSKDQMHYTFPDDQTHSTLLRGQIGILNYFCYQCVLHDIVQSVCVKIFKEHLTIFFICNFLNMNNRVYFCNAYIFITKYMESKLLNCVKSLKRLLFLPHDSSSDQCYKFSQQDSAQFHSLTFILIRKLYF